MKKSRQLFIILILTLSMLLSACGLFEMPEIDTSAPSAADFPDVILPVPIDSLTASSGADKPDGTETAKPADTEVKTPGKPAETETKKPGKPAETEAKKPADQQEKLTLQMFSKATEKEKSTAQKIIASNIRSNMSEYEKVKTIHDYLTNHITYSSNFDKDSVYTAQGAFNGDAVCQGYADAFALLCYTAGIQAEIVSGIGNNGTGSEGHAWNQVRIDNIWYNVDVTWDDPVGARIPNYDYFLVPDRVILQNHTPDKHYPAKHACTDERYRAQLSKEMLDNYAKLHYPQTKVHHISSLSDMKRVFSLEIAVGKSFVIVWDTELVSQKFTDKEITAALDSAARSKRVHGYSYECVKYTTENIWKFSFS